jgi:hypothetical protein
MSQPETYTKLTSLDVLNFARDWYAALDRHDPVGDVLPYLASSGLVLNFPEGTFREIEGFQRWYANVIHRFFDEVHRLDSDGVDFGADGLARVNVEVNWQARIWDPPAATSTWLGFDATQAWTITAGPGRPQILEYTVTDLKPMPGSGSL